MMLVEPNSSPWIAAPPKTDIQMMTLNVGTSITPATNSRTVRPELTQHHGYVHAGATTTIADVAGGFAAATLNPAGSSVLTVEFKVSLVAPAGGERLRAVARVLKPGRRITTCDVDVFGVQADGTAKICAKMLQTMMCIEARAEQDSASKASD